MSGQAHSDETAVAASSDPDDMRYYDGSSPDFKPPYQQARPSEAEGAPPLLETEGLCVSFRRGGLLSGVTGSDNILHAVQNVSILLHEGEAVGLVGESGAGKTTILNTITGLQKPTQGRVKISGLERGELNRRRHRALRHSVQMMFQDPYSSLNPRRTVGWLVSEPLRVVEGRKSRGEWPERIAEALTAVGLSPDYMHRYPHQLSGGQRQRVAIARALITGPRLLIADEPVSALDVSVQAQVLNLLTGLREQTGLAMLLVSHDLAVVRHLCSYVYVLQEGQVVEEGATAQLFDYPQHPFTRALVKASRKI